MTKELISKRYKELIDEMAHLRAIEGPSGWAPGPYRDYRPSSQTMHGVLLLVFLVSSIGLPGVVLNELLWPRILRVAGFVVVAVAFYFGLQAHGNIFYVIPCYLCCWIWVLAYFESGRLQHEKLKFEAGYENRGRMKRFSARSRMERRGVSQL
jgi:hypothetical protein